MKLCFYQDQNNWKHKLITTEVGKKNSDRVVDLLIHKNLYVVFTKLQNFSSNHYCRFVCGRCLSSYTIQNEIIKHQQRCEQEKVTSIRTTDESRPN